MTGPHLYSVGQPYIPDRTEWPEGGEYNYRSGGHELRLFFPAPSEREIGAVRAGQAEFGLYTEDDLLVLLYRFAHGPWSDAPYCWHLVPEDQREAPYSLPTPESRATLQIILVEARSGIIQVLRLVSFSATFSRALHAAIAAQSSRPWDPATYDRQLAALYQRYPSTRRLLDAAQHRTRGGD